MTGHGESYVINENEEVTKHVLYLMSGEAIPGYQGPWAEVGFELEVTLPTGPFQNVKPRVSLRLNVHPAKLEEANRFVKDWVDGKMVGVRKEVETAIREANDRAAREAAASLTPIGVPHG